MVAKLERKNNNLILDEQVKLLRQFELECIQTAYDWGFDEEVMFPTVINSSVFGPYADERLNYIVDFENSTGKIMCLAPEYRSLINDYSETIWKDKKDYHFYYCGRVISYLDRNRKEVKEDYILGVHVVNPKELMPSYSKICNWMKHCGKSFDSTKGFSVEANKNRSIDFKYDNVIVGYVKNDMKCLSGIINLTECVKQFE